MLQMKASSLVFLLLSCSLMASDANTINPSAVAPMVNRRHQILHPEPKPFGVHVDVFDEELASDDVHDEGEFLINEATRQSSTLQNLRGGTSTVMQEVLVRLKIGSYFALWYALNVVYNSK